MEQSRNRKRKDRMRKRKRDRQRGMMEKTEDRRKIEEWCESIDHDRKKKEKSEDRVVNVYR